MFSCWRRRNGLQNAGAPLTAQLLTQTWRYTSKQFDLKEFVSLLKLYVLRGARCSLAFTCYIKQRPVDMQAIDDVPAHEGLPAEENRRFVAVRDDGGTWMDGKCLQQAVVR